MPSMECEPLRQLLSFCRDHGVVTVLDVVVPQDHRGIGPLGTLLSFVDYFVPNDDEAAKLTGVTEPVDQIQVLRSYGANGVIITCGEQGAVAALEQGVWRSGCYEIETVDPSGSGDAFTAGLITGVRRGWEMPRLLAYASALGASSIGSVGCTDGVFRPSEVEAFINTKSLRVERVTK